MQKIKVLIVDDHAILRDGISALLSLAADIEVIGEAENGREAIDRARQLAPDVVLMDIAMPAMDGLEATRHIHKESPQMKVLTLTQYDDREHLLSLLEAGAEGFISKTAASSELASAIRSVYQGDSFLSPSVAKLLLKHYRQGVRVGKGQDPYDQLTDREREVLKLLAEGHTSQQIADTLVISPKTVDGHRTNLMAKLDIHNRTDLVKYALRKGIITV